MALALRINDFLVGLFCGIGIRLVDFKVEFGRLWENEQMRIVLADEISPDCCRLWDAATSDKLDKDRFRRDLGGVLEAYQEVARRLGVLTENPRPKGSGTGAGQLQAALSGERVGMGSRHCAQGQARRLSYVRSATAHVAGEDMKARIKVTLKNGVLDPQGKAIQNALASLGFTGVNDVRQGKYIEVDLAEADEARAREQVERICKELLANTVIENYAYELVR